MAFQHESNERWMTAKERTVEWIQKVWSGPIGIRRVEHSDFRCAAQIADQFKHAMSGKRAEDCCCRRKTSLSWQLFSANYLPDSSQTDLQEQLATGSEYMLKPAGLSAAPCMAQFQKQLSTCAETLLSLGCSHRICAC